MSEQEVKNTPEANEEFVKQPVEQPIEQNEETKNIDSGEPKGGDNEFSLDDFFSRPIGKPEPRPSYQQSPEGEEDIPNLGAVDTQHPKKSAELQPDDEEKQTGSGQDDVERLKAELDELKRRAEPALGLDKAVREDPKLFKMLTDYYVNQYSGENSQEAPGQPQTPQIPEKPENFDPYDAYSDPKSESYRWREAKEEAEKKMLIAQAKQEALKEMNARIEAERREAMQRQAQYAQKKAIEDFKRAKGMDDKQFKEFEQWARGKQVTLDTLYDLYKINDSVKQVERSAAENVRKQIRNTSEMPDSFANISSPRPEKKTKVDEFLEPLKKSLRGVHY